MKKELETELIEILQGTKVSLINGIDVLKDIPPELFNETMMYSLFSNFGFSNFVFCISIGIIIELIASPIKKLKELTCEKLSDADLQYAKLTYEELKNVDLRGVDLRGVDLRGVDLRG